MPSDLFEFNQDFYAYRDSGTQPDLSEWESCSERCKPRVRNRNVQVTWSKKRWVDNSNENYLRNPRAKLWEGMD